MSTVTIDQFDAYFQALHSHSPYAWQKRLAEEYAVKGSWPDAIDLPTGSGKTACIDIALFALACQASAPKSRSAPCRIFFCVNRRVIVDEAYERATRIAVALWQAEKDGGKSPSILRDVAEALRKVAGTSANDDVPPMDVLELRGGIYRDNRWARSAVQPTVVCTTIDQLGSRLLFRGYGVSGNAAPIQAALIAYDSLILLDEAHISRPFQQTLSSIKTYLKPERWALEPLHLRPVHVAAMTATPAIPCSPDRIFRLTDEERTKEPLSDRLDASKPATLEVCTDVAKKAAEIAKHITKKQQTAAVGIIVNRVATARQIYHAIKDINLSEHVELVIGSMRPVDRDAQTAHLQRLVSSSSDSRPEQTSFIISTQCLEVGADYDFDVLITECASLDALRQRFGRLNRAGRDINAQAFILANKKDAKPNDKLKDDKPADPIYGNALARTWNWLNEAKAKANGNTIDFGINAFDALLKQFTSDGQIPEQLLAPSAQRNSPIVLPAYLDFWCQTSPAPEPDPDVSLFIHGIQDAQVDIQVCWRADLVEADSKHWRDVVAMLPPTSAECMSISLVRAKQWLANQSIATTDFSDVLGNPEDGGQTDDDKSDSRTQPLGVLWAGNDKNELLTSPSDLYPGATLVLPATAGGWDELGHVPTASLHVPQAANDESDTQSTQAPIAAIDQAERATQMARARMTVRLHPSLWPACEVIQEYCKQIAGHDYTFDREDLSRVLTDAATELTGKGHSNLAEKLEQFTREADLLYEVYPDNRGIVLTSRKRHKPNDGWFTPAIDDGQDDASRVTQRQSVTLTDHTEHVSQKLADTLEQLPSDLPQEALQVAADLHDLGKADERFQAMLYRDDRTDTMMVNAAYKVLLAKSDRMPKTGSQQHEALDRSGLPKGFRHEMLSVEIAQCNPFADRLPKNDVARDLALHLIASHHGRARPLAPVVIDEEMPAIYIKGNDVHSNDDEVLSHDHRASLTPSHRIDSGISERFWSLTRRFGWWGLAYLEALLRLADQQASADEDAGNEVLRRNFAPFIKCDSAKETLGRITSPDTENHLILTGIDGTNPLGFLAAIGVFRTLSRTWPNRNIRMNWKYQSNLWQPELHAQGKIDFDTIIDAVTDTLCIMNSDGEFPPHIVLGKYKNLSIDPETFLSAAKDSYCHATINDRYWADTITSYGSDAVRHEKLPRIVPTDLHFIFGSGHQNYLDNERKLLKSIQRRHLEEALIGPWRHQDEGLSFRWDPLDAREHAYRWTAPGDEKTTGVWGANLLAFEGATWLPTMPRNGRLATTAFSRHNHRSVFTWPIWTPPLTPDVMCALLTQSSLHASELDLSVLNHRGIAVAYRAQKIKLGAGANFKWAFSPSYRS